MQKLISLFFMLIILSSTWHSDSFAHGGPEIIIGPAAQLYLDEGAFVTLPAYVSGFTMAIPGIIVGVPIGSVGYCVGAPFGEGNKFFEETTFFVIKCFCWPVSTIVGAPFYITKNTFYDFPKWVFQEKDKEQSACD